MPPPQDTNSRNGPSYGSAGAARPLMPTLASNRLAKTPVTPRLAMRDGSPASTSGTSTPPFVRAPRVAGNNSAASPVVPRAPNSFFARSPEPDSLVKPLHPTLAGQGNNITPRSASRKSRIGPDSSHSSPS